MPVRDCDGAVDGGARHHSKGVELRNKTLLTHKIRAPFTSSSREHMPRNLCHRLAQLSDGRLGCIPINSGRPFHQDESGIKLDTQAGRLGALEREANSFVGDPGEGSRGKLHQAPRRTR